ncbi:MAG: hypothetical protein P4L51_03910 [Puia sp.]|nr:hypothetical protein [Puia sp.]
MNKKVSGIELLKKNFDQVEEKFLEFFEKGEPRWPSEKRDFLRNHHQSMAQFLPTTVSFEKMKFTGLPEDILREIHSAFEAFQRGEEYN